MDNLQTFTSIAAFPSVDATRNMQQQTLVPATQAQKYLDIPPAYLSDRHYQLTDQVGSQFVYTCWPHKKADESFLLASTFEDLAELCADAGLVRNYTGEVFSPFLYGTGPGNSRIPRECQFLTFNIEHARANVTQPKHILACVDGLASFVYPTRSHSYHSDRRANYRVMVALRTPIPVEYYKQVVTRFAQRFSSLDAGVNSSYTLSDQKIEFPSCTSFTRYLEFRTIAQRGCAFDWFPDAFDACNARYSGMLLIFTQS